MNGDDQVSEARKKYCEKCEKEVHTKIIMKKELYNVRGEIIEVDAQVLVCAECGEEFFLRGIR